MFTINYPDDPSRYLCRPLFCMSNKGEFLFEFGSSFLVYNPKDALIRNLDISNCDSFIQANIYIESLVWPVLQKETNDATIMMTEEAQMRRDPPLHCIWSANQFDYT
ncbi:hypothetical protein K7X08_015890 [Anisodus acutangulus]|uniref:Uncharacterized protein n=1 Tax=Anisodus acutangulus TaxID=402998 RepID=A0A9Q1QXI0_9SOLA|nr:hypothetical protein K7X08_015890 [Anisodus acutangulus]